MFKFKGISTKDMKVVCEEEDNLLTKASQRIEEINIEGKNGTIINLLGYPNVEINLKFYVLDTTKIDKIFEWLNGEGILEYKNRVTKATFFVNIEPQRAASIKTIDCSFSRYPLWYLKNDYYIKIDKYINNFGNILSKPIIKLEKNKSSSIDLSINDVRFIYNFDEDNFVEIDCEEMNATCNGILKNRNLEIGFDFPILKPGSNKVVIHSGDATIKVKRRDCWL